MRHSLSLCPPFCRHALGVAAVSPLHGITTTIVTRPASAKDNMNANIQRHFAEIFSHKSELESIMTCLTTQTPYLDEFYHSHLLFFSSFKMKWFNFQCCSSDAPIGCGQMQSTSCMTSSGHALANQSSLPTSLLPYSLSLTGYVTRELYLELVDRRIFVR